jgi:hypothetical protein
VQIRSRRHQPDRLVPAVYSEELVPAVTGICGASARSGVIGPAENDEVAEIGALAFFR